MKEQRDAPAPLALLDVPKTFETNVEVDGVPFIFEGSISDNPKSAYLAVRLPHEEIAQLESSGVTVPKEVKIEGVVGFVGGLSSKTQDADFDLTRVRSYKENLAADPKYKNVHIGQFLLKNLAALADNKGWRLSAAPGADTVNSSRSDADVLWLLRSVGFEFGGTSPYGIRQPRKPDMSQPIAKILAN